eukprot:COSAG01_NODE_39227_length_479_cov_1.078947_1_plen_87_part_10
MSQISSNASLPSAIFLRVRSISASSFLAAAIPQSLLEPQCITVLEQRSNSDHVQLGPDLQAWGPLCLKAMQRKRQEELMLRKREAEK